MPHKPNDTEPPGSAPAAGTGPAATADGAPVGASDRRTFLKRSLLATGALALGMPAGAVADAGATAAAHKPKRAARSHAKAHRPPNILVILVDQLRTPVWMPAGVTPATVMPNLQALRAGAVNFERHYTASNDCSPSRGALVTGLYSHQTGCLITGNSHLDPGFPTWGTLLRERGYETSWWGKWHLNPDPNASLEPYGFAGGTYPSPNGAPGQGTAVDPEIAAQFAEWFREAGRGGAVVQHRLLRQPPRHRLVVPLHQQDRPGERPASRSPARSRRTSRPRKCSKRSASPACSAPSRTPPTAPSGRCRSAAPKCCRCGPA